MFSKFFQNDEISEKDKENINARLIEAMQKYDVSVAGYAIIDSYKIVTSNTISISPSIPVSINSLFQACSLSKCFTSYAVLKLVTEGKINIDLPISQQITSWKIDGSEFSDQINIRHCLNMTSGLSYGNPPSSFPGYSQDRPVPTLMNILLGQSPANNPPIQSIYQPGSQYAYSGAGYMVLQQLIEDKTNLVFTEFMQEILASLKMAHSTFKCPLDSESKINAVPGFNTDGKMLQDGWENIVTLASGGLWSTPLDIANFAIDVTNAYLGADNKNISKKIAKEILNTQDNTIFGLGFVIDGEDQSLNFRKNGHNLGYHNELLMFPNIGKGIIIMTNSANGLSVINDFIAFVANEYRWPQFSTNFDEVNKIHNFKHCK